MALDIDRDLGGEDAIFVGVLKGSLHFLSDLTRAIDRPGSTLDFIQVSSYRGERTSSGVVQIRKDLDTNIEGLNVIIVEDIVDTGATLAHLRELLGTRRPRSLRVASLLSKRAAKGSSVEVEYVGFEIPDEFVVGYGLDYGERYRSLPYIAILP